MNAPGDAPREELVNSVAEEWRHSLVERKRSGRSSDRELAQHNLLSAAAQSSSAFVQHIRASLGLGSADSEAPSLNGWRLDKEVLSPQPATATRLWEELCDGPWNRARAANETWWLRAFARWAEEGALPDPPGECLAGSIPTGALDDPESWNDDTAAAADNAIRNMLRCVGGIPHVRGQGALNIMDSSLAAAWWQAEIAHTASSPTLGIGPSFDAALRVVSRRSVWRRGTSGGWVLPQQLFRRTPRLAHPNCMAGVVLVLLELENASDNKVTAILERLASRSLLVDFDFLTPQEIVEVCR